LQNLEVLSTRKNRTYSSAVHFLHSFLGEDLQLTEKAARMIRPNSEDIHFQCPTYQSRSEDPTSPFMEQYNLYVKSRGEPLAEKITKRLANQTKGHHLTVEDVKVLWSVCAYGFALSSPDLIESCKIFTREEFLELECLHDIDWHFKERCFHGSNHVAAGERLLHFVVQRLRRMASGLSLPGAPELNVVFAFTHDNTLMRLFAVMGAFNHTERGGETLEGGGCNPRRALRASRFAPFAANLVFLLAQCPGTPHAQLRLIVNGRPTHPLLFHDTLETVSLQHLLDTAWAHLGIPGARAHCPVSPVSYADPFLGLSLISFAGTLFIGSLLVARSSWLPTRCQPRGRYR